MRRSVFLVIGAAVVVVGIVAIRHAGNQRAGQALDAALAHLPPPFAATHGPASADPVTGDTSVPDFVILRAGAPVLTAERLIASRIGAADASGVPARIGHLTLRNVAYPGGSHVDHIDIDGLELHNLQQALDAAAGRGRQPPETAALPILAAMDATNITLHVTPPPGPNGKTLPRLDSTVKHAAARGISVQIHDTSPGTDVAINLASGLREESEIAEGIAVPVQDAGTLSVTLVSITEYNQGKLREATVQGLAWHGLPGKGDVTFDHATLQNLDIRRLLDRIPALRAEPDRAAQILSNTVRIGGVDFGGLRADVSTAPLITLARASASYAYPSDGVILSNATFRNLDIVTTGRDLKPAERTALDHFGMADFSIDGSGTTRFETATGRMSLDQTALAFRGLGTLHLSYVIDGIPTTLQDPAHIDAGFSDARLISASAQWDDASLTTRLFNLASAQTGKSPEELRATISLGLMGLSAMLPEQPDAADQVNAYLDGRHSFTVTLAPATPLRLTDLAGLPPQQQAQALGVHITGN